jgi:multicomponent Na+:H+ antiporter subunit B
MKEDVIIRTISRITIPFIQLFALYVIFHGSSSAGGGFQGGVIFASGFILFGIAYGIRDAKKRIQERVTTILSSIGLYVYAGIGLFCLIFGGTYLGYGVIPLPLETAEVRKLMIELVEMGIGLTVMAIMTSIFYDIGSREENGDD